MVACQTAAAPALVELPSMDDGEGKPGGKGKEADEEAGLAGVAHNKGGALEVGGSRAWSAHAAGDAAPAAVEAERPRVPFAFQTAVLSVRMLRNWGRNPMMLAAEAVQVRCGRACGQTSADPDLPVRKEGRLGRRFAAGVRMCELRVWGWQGAASDYMCKCMPSGLRKAPPWLPASDISPPTLPPPLCAQYLFLALFVGLVYLQ